jgi:hypothetical protein
MVPDVDAPECSRTPMKTGRGARETVLSRVVKLFDQGEHYSFDASPEASLM